MTSLKFSLFEDKVRDSSPRLLLLMVQLNPPRQKPEQVGQAIQINDDFAIAQFTGVLKRADPPLRSPARHACGIERCAVKRATRHRPVFQRNFWLYFRHQFFEQRGLVRAELRETVFVIAR